MGIGKNIQNEIDGIILKIKQTLNNLQINMIGLFKKIHLKKKNELNLFHKIIYMKNG